MARVFLVLALGLAAWIGFLVSGQALLIKEQRFAFGASGRLLLVCTYAGALGSAERRYETVSSTALARSGCPSTMQVDIRNNLKEAMRPTR